MVGEAGQQLGQAAEAEAAPAPRVLMAIARRDLMAQQVAAAMDKLAVLVRCMALQQPDMVALTLVVVVAPVTPLTAQYRLAVHPPTTEAAAVVAAGTAQTKPVTVATVIGAAAAALVTLHPARMAALEHRSTAVLVVP